jgi:uncharacterized protein (DUF488 family)
VTAQSLWTVGHSTRPIAEFIALLRASGVARVADVRRHPGSRRHPQYNAGPLAAALREAGIDYEPMPELGGRRAPRPDSRNVAWRNDSFRGYADYMETPAFRAALDRLLERAGERPTAIMCAEAMWWSCHRALIADALKARGLTVLHIMDAGKSVEHPYTSAARIVGGRLDYGAASASLFEPPGPR